ncbi:hypothetical protein AB5I41_15030 [Sphingomonas sp. MMS24-JH45]
MAPRSLSSSKQRMHMSVVLPERCNGLTTEGQHVLVRGIGFEEGRAGIVHDHRFILAGGIR